MTFAQKSAPNREKRKAIRKRYAKLVRHFIFKAEKDAEREARTARTSRQGGWEKYETQTSFATQYPGFPNDPPE